LRRVILPPGTVNGGMCMLTAYFDDSGTHDTSDIVLWLGVVGNEHQWAYFSDLWAQKLQNPSPGKSAIGCFHMTDCQGAYEDFAGWGRTATDFLVHELGTIIIKTGLWSFCTAVSRKDWDELVVGADLRTAWGDAEQHCILGCFSHTTLWAKKNAQKEMAFVFDDRPHRSARVKQMFDIYRRGHLATNSIPALDSITFSSSRRFLPLQAADLLAWEQYHVANAFITRSKSPQRKQFSRIVKQGRVSSRILNRAEIKRMLASDAADPAVVADMAQKLKLDFS
jgi:hypothetical protein